MSPIPSTRLADLFPDPARPRIPDALARNLYFQSTFETEHTALTVGNTVTKTTDELQRIKSVQVGSVSGGTVTVQVQVDGRDVFDDTVRPISGGAVREPTDVYTFPAGSVISTIIEADSGTPAGTANIVIETEPYQLLPRSSVEELRGKDRLLNHKRREHELAMAGADFIEPSLIPRTKRAAVAAQSTDTGAEQLGEAYESRRDPSTGKIVIPIGPAPGGGTRPPKSGRRR